MSPVADTAALGAPRVGVMADEARVRLVDVARAAGVSIASASLAIQGKGRLADSTRARVLAEAARLGYRADPRARALRTGSTQVIAAAVSAADSELDNTCWAAAMAQATDEAGRLGYGLLLLPAEQPDLLRTMPMDALIVASGQPSDDLLNTAFELAVPVVVSRPTADGAGDRASATLDLDRGAALAMGIDYLVARGVNRVGVITSPGTGASAALGELGGIDNAEVREVPGPDAVPDALAELLALGIDGVFCDAGNAAGLAQRAEELHRKIGIDLHLAVLDDGAAADLPAVAVIGLQPRQTAEALVRVAVALARHELEPPVSVVVG